MTTIEPRIYVADLAAYNAGSLVGRWIDLDGLDVDDLHEVIQSKVLLPGHEEWAIHDYEGFGPIAVGEYDSLETVLAHVERMGDEPAKYFAYVESNGAHYADQYDESKVSGPYESVSDWFDQYIESAYGALDIESVLVAGGMDARVASGLSEILSWIDADQFALMMHCNSNVSIVKSGDEYFEVSE